MICRIPPTPCITLIDCRKNRAPLAGSILPPSVAGGSETAWAPGFPSLRAPGLHPQSSERAARTVRPPSGKRPSLAAGGYSIPKCVHCGREAQCFDADDLPSCKSCARQIPTCGDRRRRE